MSDYNDTSTFQTVFMFGLLAAIVLGGYSCQVGQCNYVCEVNKHKSEYVLMQGCYCRNSEGLYNPRDSR